MKNYKGTYIAYCDDGHDFFEMEFESEHRANSKANFEDCKMQCRRRYGIKRNTYDIKRTYLKTWC